MYEWDLDGDGELDDSTDAEPTLHLHAGRHVHGHAAGDGHVGRLGHRHARRSPSASGPDGHDRHARRPARPGAPARRSRSPARGTDVDGQRAPGLRARLGRGAAPLRRRADCHEHPIGAYPDTRRRLVHRSRPRRSPAHIEVRLTATDSDGQTEAKTAALAPRTVDVSLNATPAGAAVTLERRRGHGAGHATRWSSARPTRSTRRLAAGGRQHDLPVLVVARRAAAGRAAVTRRRATGPSRRTFAPQTPGHPDAHVRAGGRRPGRARRSPAKQLRHRRTGCAPTAAPTRTWRASCASRWPASPDG